MLKINVTNTANNQYWNHLYCLVLTLNFHTLLSMQEMSSMNWNCCMYASVDYCMQQISSSVLLVVCCMQVSHLTANNQFIIANTANIRSITSNTKSYTPNTSYTGSTEQYLQRKFNGKNKKFIHSFRIIMLQYPNQSHNYA